MSKKNSGKTVLIVVLIVALLAAIFGGFWYLYNKKTAPPVTATIEITAEGFSPQVLQITPGTRVTWVNRDSSPHQVVSGPYPEQNVLPSLNSNDLGPGASYTYTFTEKGSFPFYDHTQPTREGSIEVQ